MKRRWMAVLLAASLFACAGTAQALMSQPFFQDSFLNMPEDAQEAAEAGRILMVFYEQEGCPYCKKLHEETLSDPKVRRYLEKNFHAIQIDIFGARETVDFSGKEMTEKQFSRNQRIHFTPVVSFYAPDGRELFRLPGLWRPFHFLAGMEFVKKGLYKTINFQDLIRQKAREQSAGK